MNRPSAQFPQPTMIRRPTWERWLSGSFAPVIALIVFSPSIKYEFIGWDDGAYVTLNRNLQNLEGLGKIWFSDENEQYYPLTFSTYWVEYHLWGLNPAGYHATNVAMHALNTVLLASILVKLGLGPGLAIFVSLIFAVHPAQVMTVAWVSARRNLLSTFFVLLTIHCWVSFRRTPSKMRYVTAMAGFVAAMLSKTAVGLLPVVLMTIDLVVIGKPFRATLRALWPFFLLVVPAAVVTSLFEQKFVGAVPDWGERILIATTALWFYGWTFVLPFHLTPIYPLWHVDSTRLIWFLPLASLMLLLVALVRFRRMFPPLAMFGLVLAIAMLLPTLGLVPFGNMLVSYVSDHYLYLPIVGLALAATSFLDAAARTSRAARVMLMMGAAGLVVVFARESHAYLPAFRDVPALWTRTLASNPDCYPAHAGLARHYVARQEWALAIHHQLRASQIEPSREQNQYLGEIHLMAREWTGAKQIFGGLAVEHPNWASPVIGLAFVAEKSGDLPTAISLYERAAGIEPGIAEPHIALGSLYLGLQDRERAIDHFEKAILLRPSDGWAYVGLATCYRGLGDQRRAAMTLENAIVHAPTDVRVLNSLSRTLAASSDDTVRNGQRAVELASRAVSLAGRKNVDLLDTLAAGYAELGEFGTALQVIDEAMKTAGTLANTGAIRVLGKRRDLYAQRIPLRESTFQPVSGSDP